MKSLVFFAALVVSSASIAQSTRVSFTHFGHYGSHQSYYACSYVESQAYKYLDLLGAGNARVRCSGGIQSGWYSQPVHVTASFDLPEVSGGLEEVEIRGDVFRPSCGINAQMLNEFIKVMPHVELVRKTDSCAFSNSNYFFLLNVAR